MRSLATRHVLVLLATGLLWGTGPAHALEVSVAQAQTAGKQLWQNECAGTVAGLTSWNPGEDFASLGIGHYIWYPVGRRGPFEESFPELLAYLQRHGVTLPGWLQSGRACPWPTREVFEQSRNGAQMKELRELLAGTVSLQAQFSARRLEAALPKMLAALPASQRDPVEQRFRRVAISPKGVYALVDYVNFKGEGVLPTERYQDQGWGLLQVLAGMHDDPNATPGPEATREFSRSAARVLAARVDRSPPERHEAKWLPGWKSRVATYAP